MNTPNLFRDKNLNFRTASVANNPYSAEIKRTPPISGWRWIFWNSANSNDNNYPVYLASLKTMSPVHATALANKIAMITGEDFVCLDSRYENILLGRHGIANRLKLWDLWRKMVTDYETYGGVAIFVRWAKEGHIAGLEHLDFGSVRIGRENWDARGMRTFYVSNDWANIFYPAEAGESIGPAGNNYPRAWAEYNPSWIDRDVAERQGETSAYCQIYYYADYTPQNNFYPVPNYSAAIQYIQLEAELAQFHRATVQNGFSPSAIMQIVNSSLANVEPPAEIPPEDPAAYAEWQYKRSLYDAKQQFLDNIREYFTGSGNGGKIMIQIVNSKDELAQFTAVPKDLSANTLEELTTLTRSAIISAHQLNSPVMAGIPPSASFGGLGNESISANALFNENYAKPRRRNLLRILNELLDKIHPGLGCLGIKSGTNIAFTLTDAAQAQIMTINERRMLAGLGPIEGGDQIVGLTENMPEPNLSRNKTDMLIKPLGDPKF